jgi:lipoprotein-releasing system ATP-binding protein
MNEALIQVKGVSKEFDREGRPLEVLKDVHLEIGAGEMVAIVGQSGAGKSTLLHIMGTLDVPTSGRIHYAGRDVTSLSGNALAKFRNRHIGFVFQFHHLLPDFDALENVMMPGLIRGEPRAGLRDRARALLAELGLEARAGHRPSELSGGEQQRVALARALVMQPDVILADEPTGNLDSATSERMNDLFFHVNRTHGTTFVVVTHSRELADRMPRVVRMRDGRIESDPGRPGREPEVAPEGTHA